MTNTDVQKLIDWNGKHGESIDDLIAGHRDYTEASRHLGTEPVLATLHRCQLAMGRFVAMIDRNQSLPHFGVSTVDRHYRTALDLYRKAGEKFKRISSADTPEVISQQIVAVAALLGSGTEAVNQTTAAIATLAERSR